MAYAVLQNVRDLIPQVVISETTKPSQGTVEDWLAQVHRIVDATLRNLGYAVPIADANSDAYAIMRDVVAHGVAARVIRSRFYGAGDPKAAGGDDLQRFYDDVMRRLADPKDPFELDAPRTGSELVKVDPVVVESPTSVDGSVLDEDPPVTMGQVF